MTDVSQPNFCGLKVATSSVWRSVVAFGWIEIKVMLNSEDSSFHSVAVAAVGQADILFQRKRM
jgi:hypothetical protein